MILKNKSGILVYMSAIICGILVLGLDQLTKYAVMTSFELGETREFLNGFIDLVYIHNRGAAWGMLSGKTFILLALSLALMVGCVVFLLKTANKSKLIFWALTFVVAGGIGNLIDRIFRDGNVIDFLHFEFWPDFPVFNLADCSIVLGAGLLILYFVSDAVSDYKKKALKNDAKEEENADN